MPFLIEPNSSFYSDAPTDRLPDRADTLTKSIPPSTPGRGECKVDTPPEGVVNTFLILEAWVRSLRGPTLREKHIRPRVWALSVADYDFASSLVSALRYGKKSEKVQKRCDALLAAIKELRPATTTIDEGALCVLWEADRPLVEYRETEAMQGQIVVRKPPETHLHAELVMELGVTFLGAFKHSLGADAGKARIPPLPEIPIDRSEDGSYAPSNSTHQHDRIKLDQGEAHHEGDPYGVDEHDGRESTAANNWYYRYPDIGIRYGDKPVDHCLPGFLMEVGVTHHPLEQANGIDYIERSNPLGCIRCVLFLSIDKEQTSSRDRRRAVKSTGDLRVHLAGFRLKESQDQYWADKFLHHPHPWLREEAMQNGMLTLQQSDFHRDLPTDKAVKVPVAEIWRSVERAWEIQRQHDTGEIRQDVVPGLKRKKRGVPSPVAAKRARRGGRGEDD